MLSRAITIPAYLPPGVYRYTETDRGRATEVTKIVVTRRGGEIRIAAKTAGSLHGAAFSANESMLLGADLAPVRYDGAYNLGARGTTASVSARDASAEVTNTPLGAQSRTVTLAAGTQHFTVSAPGLLIGWFALAAQLHRWNVSSVTAIVPILAQTGRLDVSRRAIAQRPHDVPKRDAVLTVAGPVPFTIWYDPITFVPDELDEPSRRLVTTRLRNDAPATLARYDDGTLARTTLKRACPLIIRAYASGARSSGIVSIIARTPVCTLKRMVSSESAPVPEGQAWIE